MGTNNYNLPLISGLSSVKVPRDFNALSNAIDDVMKLEIQRLDNATSSLGSLSPKGVYPTFSALQTAKPTGDTGTYLVSGDGKWYFWNASAWVAGGNYQSTGISNKAVSFEKTTFLDVGKNKFDKSTRSIGMVVSETNGVLSSDLGTGYDTSDYIPVQAGTTYYINKVRKFALYDAAKSFVSGVNNSSYGSATFTPAVDGYVRFYVGQPFVNTTQLEIGSSGTGYEGFKYLAPKMTASSLDVGIVKDENIAPGSSIVLKRDTKNLLDMSKVTPGYYVDYATGNLVANVDNKATDFIALLPNTTYTLSNQSTQVATKDLSQLAFYSSSKQYVSGMANTGTQASITFTTGATVNFMRVTIPTSISTGMMLEKGTTVNPFEPYKVTISKEDLPTELFSNQTKVVTVKPDGTGDFTNPRMALASITDASSSKTYTVELYEGLYDVFSYYSVAELNDASFDGLRIPDYVSIKGIGDGAKIILQGFLPDDEVNVTFTSHGRISTICPLGNGNIENVTITGKNLRYAVHDDYNYPNAKKIMRNCRFIRYKGNGRNYGGKQAWGEGSWSGQQFIFEDCTFTTEWDYYAYTSHSNDNFAQPSFHKFVNCKFFTTLGVSSLRFESLTSNQKNMVILNGTKLNAAVDLTCHASNTSGVIDHVLSGFGNDIVPLNIVNGDGKSYAFELTGETKEMFNGGVTDILKGQPVMLNSTGTSIVPFTGNGKIRFFGIALKDIPTQSKGIVRVSGYLKINDTALTGLAIGDAVGVMNGSLAKVTTTDYIGSVVIDDFIKLN